MGPAGPGGERLQRARQLDREALTAIYDEFHQPIYGYVYRQVDNVEIARDLTADVFRRLLQALKAGTGPDRNEKAWLFRTAHNLVIDHYRSQQFRRHLPLNQDSFEIVDDPAEVAERHLAMDEVFQVWHQLTPDQRQVVALKFLHEMSNEEVAEIMGKPITAVKMLQHRALAAIRRELKKNERQVRV